MILWEKAPFQVDVEQLRADLAWIRTKYEPYMVSKSYGGWSLTSWDGDYRDGWLKRGASVAGVVHSAMSIEEFQEFQRSAGLHQYVHDYIKPTQICTPYLTKIIDDWKNLGLHPCRVRLALLKPGAEVPWHQDTPDSIYCVRLHAAIETNAQCSFDSEDASLHMPADGSAWFVQVNRMHRVQNLGRTERVHLMANVFDRKGLTQSMQFEMPKKSPKVRSE